VAAWASQQVFSQGCLATSKSGEDTSMLLESLARAKKAIEEGRSALALVNKQAGRARRRSPPE
jgi:t-SNARE complex subunit (syntaxin)